MKERIQKIAKSLVVTLGLTQAAATAVGRCKPSGFRLHDATLLPDKDTPFGHPGGTANQTKTITVQIACAPRQHHNTEIKS